MRTGEQPVDGALVLRSGTPDEAVVPMLDTLDVDSCPGSIRSICRNSAGRTIWPLEETVVFMQVRYRLTWGNVKRYTQATMPSISDWNTARTADGGQTTKVRNASTMGSQRNRLCESASLRTAF